MTIDRRFHAVDRGLTRLDGRMAQIEDRLRRHPRQAGGVNEYDLRVIRTELEASRREITEIALAVQTAGRAVVTLPTKISVA
jgi:hypothetical protein